MRAEEHTMRFERMQEEFQMQAWRIAHEPGDHIIVSCAATDELITSDLHMDGFFNDEEEFAVQEWNDQINMALGGAPLWFFGIAFPFTATEEHFLAVVALDSITTSFCRIMVETRNAKKRPVRWEPLLPFPKLNDLLVVPRRLVTPQG